MILSYYDDQLTVFLGEVETEIKLELSHSLVIRPGRSDTMFGLCLSF